MNNSKNRVLEINNLNKFFYEDKEKVQVLENISLSLVKGEILALVGPSGCGKSTILNIIAGLLETECEKARIKVGARIAYVFQEPRLLPWKSVDDNIAFIQKNFMEENEAAEIRNKLLSDLDLLAAKKLYPAQLSGGMKQRLEIVRALAIKPELLMLDEAFKSLDLALKYQLKELLLQEYKNNNFAILMVTHDPEEAVMLADRVMLLSKKPAVISNVFEIGIDREARELKDERVYDILQEITELIIKKQ